MKTPRPRRPAPARRRVPAARPPAARPRVAAPVNGPQDPERLSRTELLALAKRAGLPGRHRLAKPALIRELVQLGVFRDAAPAAPVSAPPAATIPRAAVPPAVSPPPSGPLSTSAPAAALPDRYRVTELVALIVDPLRVFLYWEITPEAIARARTRLGAAWDGAAFVLRAYHVADESEASVRHQWDTDVDGEVGTWYLPLWSADQLLVFDLGWRASDGRFAAAARSNHIRTPRNAPDDTGGERWMTVIDGRIVAASAVERDSAAGNWGETGGPSSYSWAVRRSR